MVPAIDRVSRRAGCQPSPPDGAALSDDFDVGAGLVEHGDKLPGMAETLEFDNPGMHTTDTVDFVTILAGEVWLELDNSEEVLLQPGHCLVQNGTRHAWRNKSSRPCVTAVAMVGATRRGR